MNIGEIKFFDMQALEPVTLTEERPIDPGEVMLIDPMTGSPTRARWAFLENGKRVRQSVRSGALIPYPKKEKTKDTTVYGFDTPADDVLEKSFVNR